MSVAAEILEHHDAHRIGAEAAYISSLRPALYEPIWREAVLEAEKSVTAALAATENLSDVRSALALSGRHMEVLRALMAPPLSQDQFKLRCKSWTKSSEKKGTPLKGKRLAETVAAWQRWADPVRVGWINDGSKAAWAIRAGAIAATAHMIAIQRYRTRERMKLALEQEMEAVDLLEELGFRRAPAQTIDRHGMLGQGEYMHQVQFETADGSAHEVDVAVGLGAGRILALECKVSNDKTNSTKRVNDVMKKASAWRDQWGKMVYTGALLSGVYSAKEPRRMLESDIHLFWSHQLPEFASWLESHRA